MEHDSTILVTGAGGMVGGALSRTLRKRGFVNVLSPLRSELDLTDRLQVLTYFEKTRPSHVFMVAAKVGGIAANIADPVGFITENTRIEINLFEAAHRVSVEKSLFLGSSCIYPREATQPMSESALMTGLLEPTNEGYAIAKILGIRLAQAYERQFETRSVCLIPASVYGTGDHFEFSRSHVLSAFVRRFVEAAEERAAAITVWGTGAARREFLHVDDLVEAMLLMMDLHDGAEIINVGPGSDVSIRELAELVGRITGYQGRIEWDHSKPDGMPRKLMDVSKISTLGWRPQVSLEQGVSRTIAEYRALTSAAGFNPGSTQ